MQKLNLKKTKLGLLILLFSLLAIGLNACGEEARPALISPTAVSNPPTPTFNTTGRVTLAPYTPTPLATPYPTLPPNASQAGRILATIAVSRGQGQGLEPTPTANSSGVRPGVSQPKVVQVETDNFRPKIEFTEIPGLTDGVPVLVTFDSLWCAFCSQIQPQINNLKTQFSAQVRFANLDFNSNANQLFIQRYKITSAPTTLLLDKSGVDRKMWVGLILPQDLEQALREILASSN